MEIAKKARRSDAITFVVSTYNEEKRIEWAIKNFLPWGRVLIVDNYSEDRTVEIARSYGCEVLLNKNPGWPEDEVTVSRVKAAVQTEWIYWGYADELVSADTLDAIIAAIESGKYSIVNIARKNYYYGEFCNDAYADRLNRIFKMGAIDFTENIIHLFGKVSVPESQICFLDLKRFFVHHFNSYTSKSYLSTMDRYTDTQADSLVNMSTPHSWLVEGLLLLAKSAKTVGLNLILRRGYKAGKAGLFLVTENIYYRCLLSMKIHERRSGLNRDSIEDKHNVLRSEILKFNELYEAETHEVISR